MKLMCFSVTWLHFFLLAVIAFGN